LEASKDSRFIAGVGDWVCFDDPGATLVTYALGSCVGVTAYDPQARCGGMLHFMLPESSLNLDKARLKPGMFCDTGLSALLSDLQVLGASQSRLRVHLAGGATVLDPNGRFDIGRRNILAVKRRLWELGLMVEDEDTGGERSRTLKLSLKDGKVTVRDILGERELGNGPLGGPFRRK
jgi:chemotaxis protein CheD